MSELNERQRDILAFITDYSAGEGRPPTIREIAAECEISSTSVVAYHLDRLQAAGYVERDAQISRGTRLVTPAGRFSRWLQKPGMKTYKTWISSMGL